MLNMGLVRTNYIWAEEFFQPIIKHQNQSLSIKHGDLMVTFWCYWMGFIVINGPWNVRKLFDNIAMKHEGIY